MLFTCKNSDLNHLKTLVYESKSHTKLHYSPLDSHLEYDVILPLSNTLKQNLRVFSESICKGMFVPTGIVLPQFEVSG